MSVERVRIELKQDRSTLGSTWRGMTVRDRFESKIRVTPGCWLWLGEKGGKGYGRLEVRGRYQMAHRLSYEFYVGQIPNGMIMCHTCDNPSCVNPDHLWPGTDQSNSDDKMKKGRWRCGERKPGQKLSYAKLQDEDVYAIRADARSYSEIARAYGLVIETIRAIKLRMDWTHLPPRGDEQDSVDGRSLRQPKLSLEQQRAVRADPRPRKEISAEFGVGLTVIGLIKKAAGIYSHLASEA